MTDRPRFTGCPRAVPRTIVPELRPPATGNALYMFKLPERRAAG